jgi:Leucine-rich repeat (LRR) protein
LAHIEGRVCLNLDPAVSQIFELVGIGLNGTIPEEVSGLSLLHTFTVALNPALQGTIPETLFRLANLTDVRVFECALTGNIPDSLGGASLLTNLAIQMNQLSGRIPSSIGSLTVLETLDAFENRLSGELPSEIGNLSQLRSLYIESNQLSGSIPSEMLRLTSLRQLTLSFNSFTSGAEDLCPLRADRNLIAYSTDCFSQTVPAIPREIECSCCTQCCSDLIGCLSS